MLTNWDTPRISPHVSLILRHPPSSTVQVSLRQRAEARAKVRLCRQLQAKIRRGLHLGRWVGHEIHGSAMVKKGGCVFCGLWSSKHYPLVNIQKNYGKSQILMGKLTINGHFQ